MTKKIVSTYEREIKNRKFKKKFEQQYQEILLSELLITMMDNDNKSVRQLAKEIGLSATVIQKVRSGRQDDLKMQNFINISHACGYRVFLEKGRERIAL